MGDHSPLPNPYASTLAPDVAERSSAALYLLAGALSAGMAVGGGPAGVASAQDARGDAAEYVAVTAVREAGDARVTDRVGVADAEKFIDGVAARLARDRVRFEARLAALRPDDVGIDRATRELHGLWQPAADGIHELAISMARVAVRLDVVGAESPAGTEPVGLPQPEPTASPALVAQAAAGQPSGRAVIELAVRWTDSMLVDLCDSLDMMVDRIETAWPGEPPAPGSGAANLERNPQHHPDRPALSLVRSVL